MNRLASPMSTPKYCHRTRPKRWKKSSSRANAWPWWAMASTIRPLWWRPMWASVLKRARMWRQRRPMSSWWTTRFLTSLPRSTSHVQLSVASSTISFLHVLTTCLVFRLLLVSSFPLVSHYNRGWHRRQWQWALFRLSPQVYCWNTMRSHSWRDTNQRRCSGMQPLTLQLF